MILYRPEMGWSVASNLLARIGMQMYSPFHLSYPILPYRHRHRIVILSPHIPYKPRISPPIRYHTTAGKPGL